MLLTADEIARSSSGAWALFKGDPQGMRAFDVSLDGFWRSFGVLVLLLPAIAILIASEKIFLLAQLPVVEETFPSGAFVTSRVVGFLVGWVDYPIVLALLAKPLGLTRRYVPLIVALNWTSLVAAVPTVFPHALHILGIAGEGFTSLLGLIALGVVLRYQFVVTRVATGAAVGFSIGLVALDFLLGIAVSAVMTGPFGV